MARVASHIIFGGALAILAGSLTVPVAAEPLSMAPAGYSSSVIDRYLRDDRVGDEPRAPLASHLRRQVVPYSTIEAPGTIIIDTPNTYLYLVLGNGKAMRYGIGVGREGFTWSGVESITKMTEWPDWYPPAEMISRQPYLPRFMAGGPGNPLGARALYLGNTVYRIHGTNDPSTIGKRVSSGCIRLTNEDVADLYGRAKPGTKVVVLPISSRRSASLSPAASARPATSVSRSDSDLTYGLH
jgi:lipoprotein-anchoring transpeptidase ErfK/SrfK